MRINMSGVKVWLGHNWPVSDDTERFLKESLEKEPLNECSTAYDLAELVREIVTQDDAVRDSIFGDYISEFPAYPQEDVHISVTIEVYWNDDWHKLKTELVFDFYEGDDIA